jgi:hypothetical protein
MRQPPCSPSTGAGAPAWWTVLRRSPALAFSSSIPFSRSAIVERDPLGTERSTHSAWLTTAEAVEPSGPGADPPDTTPPVREHAGGAAGQRTGGIGRSQTRRSCPARSPEGLDGPVGGRLTLAGPAGEANPLRGRSYVTTTRWRAFLPLRSTSQRPRTRSSSTRGRGALWATSFT